jgi:hypothetical protein
MLQIEATGLEQEAGRRMTLVSLSWESVLIYARSGTYLGTYLAVAFTEATIHVWCAHTRCQKCQWSGGSAKHEAGCLSGSVQSTATTEIPNPAGRSPMEINEVTRHQSI